MNATLSYNSILLSITSLLDYTEMDILENVTNHGRRVAYISLRIGELLGFSTEDLFDLGALALLHDVGAAQSISNQILTTIKRDDLEKFRDHCIIGQKILDNTSRFSKRSECRKIFFLSIVLINRNFSFITTIEDLPACERSCSVVPCSQIHPQSQGRIAFRSIASIP